MRPTKLLGGLFLGLLLAKVAGRRHAMAGGFGPRHGPWSGGHGPWSGGHGPRRGFGPGGNDPRRQWIRDFHRSLHEEDSAAGANADPTNPDPTTAV